MLEAIVMNNKVERFLIGIKGRSGIVTAELHEGVVENQRQFGRSTSDYDAMVMAHRGNSPLDKILGMREVVTRRCSLVLEGEYVVFEEANPKVKNIWMGPGAKLMTVEDAAKRDWAGKTALYWATQGGQNPERVAQAWNGYFYPATAQDIILPVDISIGQR